jgi:hypothetical protein
LKPIGDNFESQNLETPQKKEAYAGQIGKIATKLSKRQ